MEKFYKVRKKFKYTGQRLSNLDYYYGPWESIQDACENVPVSVRERGLTVGIYDDREGVIEYQWKEGTEDGHLVEKVERLNLVLSADNTELTFEEGSPVSVSYNVQGRAGIQKGFLYKVVGTSEVFIKEFYNIGKGSNSLIIDDISESGAYVYRIKILDTSGAYARCETNDYIEYQIKYGGISVKFNFTEINSIKIKNINSISGKQFTCFISVRDDTFVIDRDGLGVFLSDNNGINISLTPKNAQGQSSDTYLGYNYYQIPDESQLQQLDGKQCYIIVKYKEGINERTNITPIFTLLQITSLELISLTEQKDYYKDFPSDFVFQLQSGVENLSVIINQNPSSDFRFEQSTVISYRRFSLRVIPREVKNDANIIINYTFTYNNNSYTGTFTCKLGNILEIPQQIYYNPPVGESISRDDIIFSDATNYDIAEGGSYYKLIQEPFVSSSFLSSSFLLDLYCKIPKTSDSTTKYLKIKYGNAEIAYIDENDISCRDIITDTPLNEWIQIGIGCNLQESIERNNSTVSALYDAIYINGMVVKNQITQTPLEFVHGTNLTVELSNGIFVQKCIIYYDNGGHNFINPNTSYGSIIYNNYKVHNLSFQEPENLPVLKLLRINDSDEISKYFNYINNYKNENNEDPISYVTIFGNIGEQKRHTMSDYDYLYGQDGSGIEHKNTSLFRQHVDIKKPAQKEYCVLCRGQYFRNSANLLDGIIVEVHTQGTSTLAYSVPNFRFIFWQDNGESVIPAYPELILKNSEGQENEYYQERIYTAKADYMDSSHLNNTPTCNYYNNLVKSLIDLDKIEGSPSAQAGKLDAIMGFPIILEISDSAQSFDNDLINIGSFMLNIDKTGDSLGFEIVDENNNQLHCISFEGTSNDDGTGASGRFTLPNNGLEYFADDSEINSAYDLVQQNIGNINEGDLTGYPYAQWCEFLSDGLEYRYPDSDIIKYKNGKLSKVMKLNDFKKLYRMWSWVSKSGEYTVEQYQSEFQNYFDLEYCMIYFIQLMIFGQTDNLGKNAMFDCWDGQHWYPRPYDLDSQAGLDNNGNDNIAPFVEIKPEFSLDYDPTKSNDYAWRAEHHLIGENIYNGGELIYPVSQIQYGSQLYDRYHYSSHTSKLWINFYKNYKTTIEGFYSDLRRNCNYTPESIINLCQTQLIDVLGINQYNQDFKNKYFGNSDQSLAYGNRWNKFKKWITKRFAFCDSYFGIGQSVSYDINSIVRYDITVDSPQYITSGYQTYKDIRFVIEEERDFVVGSGGATKFTLQANQPSVLKADFFKYVSNPVGSLDFSGLILLDVTGNRYINNINTIVGNNLPVLRELLIDNSSINIINLVPSVKKLSAKNVRLNTLTFQENSNVEEINLNNSTIIGSVDFSGLKFLKELDLTNCTFENDISFENLESLETLIINNTTFKGTVDIKSNVNIKEFNFSNVYLQNISFSGNDLEIETLNFVATRFNVTQININEIVQNIKNLYFNNCSGLQYLQITVNKHFNNLEKFSIANSSITALGGDSQIFDASFFNFNSEGTIKQINRMSSNYTITSYKPFTFENTGIQTITNLAWYGSGENLFFGCKALQSISGSLTLSNSINHLFDRCEELTTIPNINLIIILSSVTSARCAFAGTSKLSYSTYVSGIIEKCQNVTNFYRVCWARGFAENQEINLNVFNNNVTDLSEAFSTYIGSDGNYYNYDNKIIVTGRMPKNVENLNRVFLSISRNSSLEIPYDIIKDTEHLNSLDGAFAWVSNLNIRTSPSQTKKTISSDFFPPSNKNNIENINSIFARSGIFIENGNVFDNLTSLKTSVASFAQFSPISTLGGGSNIDITNLWKNCEDLKDISGCFYNIINVTITNTINFHNSFNNSNKKVVINGLLGLSKSRQEAQNLQDLQNIINVKLNTIANKIADASNYYNVVTTTPVNYSGVFEGRNIYLRYDEDDSNKIFDNLSCKCIAMFKNTNIIIDSDITQFNLTGIKSLNNMFEGSYLWQSGGGNKYVTINMPTGCTTYDSAFRLSHMLASLPKILSSSAQSFNRTFSGAKINLNICSIPSDYFQICKESLISINSMFENNQYITDFTYSDRTGLFSGCINLKNATSVFKDCHFLHGGIPKNLFGTQTLEVLEDISSMFERSSIFRGTIGVNKWIASDTFSPLSKVKNISGMFKNICRITGGIQGIPSEEMNINIDHIDNGAGGTVNLIDPDAFLSMTSLENISSLFEYAFPSNITVPIVLSFYKFVNGSNAFYGCNITKIGSQFVRQNINNIATVSCMFVDPANTPSRSITNLNLFINSLNENLNVNKSNMAGGLIGGPIDPNDPLYSLYVRPNEIINYPGYTCIREIID